MSPVGLGTPGGSSSCRAVSAPQISPEGNAVVLRSPDMQNLGQVYKEGGCVSVWEVEGALPRSLWLALPLLSALPLSDHLKPSPGASALHQLNDASMS